jgi:cation diffusion facilitator CzcD-associated flavoprotein CzcO
LYTQVLIIGASISGLATAACLRRGKVEFVLIEKEGSIAAPWRHHYDRLHLHTNKRLSGLPFRKWGSSAPRYPSRLEVIDYLEDYQRAFEIRPQFHTEARSVRKSEKGWVTETETGVIESDYVVMATGAYGKPRAVEFSGLEGYPGRVVHSFDYKTGADYAGQRVLVVGFGNSACEIAMDLDEHGAEVSMAVRSPVNVIPRDILGIPVLELSLLLRYLPPRLADRISAPLVRGVIGDVSRLGLERMPYGPIEQIVKDGMAPVLDIGIVRLIRDGRVRVFGGLDRIEGAVVRFGDGRSDVFDAIVAGIGYERNCADIVEVDQGRFDDLHIGVGRQRYFGADGLYFCGYWVSPTGQIREIARDARKIAADIGKREKITRGGANGYRGRSR